MHDWDNFSIFTDKFFDFNQTSQNDFFGDAFVTNLKDRTKFENFYAEGNVYAINKKLGCIKGYVGYVKFNYGYDRLVQIDGNTINNRLSGNVISVGGEYDNTIGEFKVSGKFGINVTGDLDGNYFNAKASYNFNELVEIEPFVNLNSRAPNFNYLLHQSGYINYNWQNAFNNVQTKQFGAHVKVNNIVNASVDYTTINNYTFFF